MYFRRNYAGSKDADLVVLVADGNEKAFKTLLNRHQNSIYRFAVRFLGDASEAEDITQEAFVRFLRAVSRYRPEAALRTYLLSIARNLCMDHIRKKRPELMDHLPEKATTNTPLDDMERAEFMRQLIKAVQGLPENQRTAILLRHDHDMRYDEIAETMDLSVSAVESLLVRARRTLREVFDIIDFY
jgi:RNA polymerase sigma-70 factor (ECF subfamily)